MRRWSCLWEPAERDHRGFPASVRRFSSSDRPVSHAPLSAPRGAAWTVELLNRDQQAARIIIMGQINAAHQRRQLQDGLHRAFAEGGRIADDDGALVILQCAR